MTGSDAMRTGHGDPLIVPMMWKNAWAPVSIAPSSVIETTASAHSFLIESSWLSC